MKIKMYNYIIFDVDGTLIDTEKAVVSSYQKLIHEKFGRYFTMEELAVGHGVPTRTSLERYGFTDIDAICERYHGYLREALKEARVFEGVMAVLRHVESKNIITGVVTSRNRLEIAHDPRMLEITQYFRHIVCSDDTKKHKPDGEPILKFLELSGAKASETIYIGDTPFDCMCARNAGVDFALALWGAIEKDSVAADYYFKSPEEIISIL